MLSRQGLIQQFVWNRAASERGLQGVGVTVRHTPRALLPESEILEAENETPQRKKRASKFANAGTQKDIQLTWMGSPIFPERKTLDQDTLNLIRMVEPVVEIKPSAPLGQPRRGPGRPRKEVDAVITSLKGMKGPKPTLHLAPSPRGGQIAVRRLSANAPKRGRPIGSKNKVQVAKDAG